MSKRRRAGKTLSKRPRDFYMYQNINDCPPPSHHQQPWSWCTAQIMVATCQLWTLDCCNIHPLASSQWAVTYIQPCLVAWMHRRWWMRIQSFLCHNCKQRYAKGQAHWSWNKGESQWWGWCHRRWRSAGNSFRSWWQAGLLQFVCNWLRYQQNVILQDTRNVSVALPWHVLLYWNDKKEKEMLKALYTDQGEPNTALVELLEMHETSMGLSPLLMVISMGKNLFGTPSVACPTCSQVWCQIKCKRCLWQGMYRVILLGEMVE